MTARLSKILFQILSCSFLIIFFLAAAIFLFGTTLGVLPFILKLSTIVAQGPIFF